MNPLLNRLQPYPFEKLRKLFAANRPDPAISHINFGIGEPKHSTPSFIRRALRDNLDGLSKYPATLGTLALRESIAVWLNRRYKIPAPDPADTRITRSTLFAGPDRTRPV